MLKKISALTLAVFLAWGSLFANSGTTVFPRPPRQLTRGLQVVPSSLTDVTSTTTVLYQLVVANTTGSAVTFLVQDKASTPKTLIPTVSIAANTVYVIAFPEGTYLTGGMKWQAGTGAALHADVNALYQ